MKKALGFILLLTFLLTGCYSENIATTTNTDSQSVYKTIDYYSYEAESSSTEFDDLVDKKVTFTNVPTFAGYLGKLDKSISCGNESDYIIEDDAEYTVTGIVSYTAGTVIVSLDDCTITKNEN